MGIGYFKKLALILQDIHFPYHDEITLKNILFLLKDIAFDIIIFNGDIFDFHQLSKYLCDPKRRFHLQEELDVLFAFLCKVRQNNKNIIKYILGNHESRLQDYLFRKAPELSGLRSLVYSELLQLNRLDIQLIEDEYKLNDKLVIRHGGKCGKYPSKTELNSWMQNAATGHAHKDDYCNINTNLDSFEHFSLGHLSDQNQLKKQYAQQFAHTWNKSFGIVEFNEDDYHFHRIKVNKSGSFYCPINRKYYENKL